MPKVNMYQSLHTTVIGPRATRYEIQIRTWEMHRIAEEGIAAHWLYKEKKTGKDKLDESLLWLRQLIETQQDTKDPREFPRQRARRPLPRRGLRLHAQGRRQGATDGATPIDFAFAVHTKVGEHCVGAKATASWSAAHDAATGRHGGDRDLAQPAPEPRLAQVRQVHARAHQDQPVAQDRGAHALDRARARAVRARGERSTA